MMKPFFLRIAMPAANKARCLSSSTHSLCCAAIHLLIWIKRAKGRIAVTLKTCVAPQFGLTWRKLGAVRARTMVEIKLEFDSP
jgi:hypothetical protein